jgi:hypothetical protein
VLRAYRMRVHNLWLVRASSLDPLWASAFNAVGGRCAPPYQDTTEPCRVNVLYVGVRDLGEIEWSCRCCIGLAFGKVLISPTSCGHLTLVVASHSSPCGMGVLGYLIHPWPTNGDPPTV